MKTRLLFSLNQPALHTGSPEGGRSSGSLEYTFGASLNCWLLASSIVRLAEDMAALGVET